MGRERPTLWISYTPSSYLPISTVPIHGDLLPLLHRPLTSQTLRVLLIFHKPTLLSLNPEQSQPSICDPMPGKGRGFLHAAVRGVGAEGARAHEPEPDGRVRHRARRRDRRGRVPSQSRATSRWGYSPQILFFPPFLFCKCVYVMQNLWLFFKISVSQHTFYAMECADGFIKVKMYGSYLNYEPSWIYLRNILKVLDFAN